MSIDIKRVKKELVSFGKIGFASTDDLISSYEQQQAEIEKMDEVIREMVTQLWKRDFCHRELKLTEQPRSIQSACKLLNIKK